ncbi:restriction endonuclease subunit S [uncultured Duncaniella sp.]|jgi:type I restriction enzyme S subunit|uniref:restriction endonuclease subunit S n=2 Tax=uncultured Duncaniella sp. TaxID=2768039 RepID=UPI0025ADAAD2|nr:restriction endonuclease subunit S [uncultured Duncaniella sp.]
MYMTKLSSIADYVTDKISSNDIALREYVTTDCILQNKKGREIATNLPPQSCCLTRYQRGDVLIANIRPYLKKVWFADIDGGASSDVLVFRAKEGHSPSFLYAVLLQNSFFDYVMQGAKGSKMPRGDKEQILRYEMPTLSCSEESIGTFFLNLDQKIRLDEQINQNLEAMAKQLYDYWFVQFDFPNEEGKPYKSSGGKMVWNEKLKREIPEGWNISLIKDIATTYSGGTPKSTNIEYYDNGEIAWINSGELNSPIITKTTNYITKCGLENSSAKLYPSNSILVAMYGATAGKVSLLTFEACSNQAVCGVIPTIENMLYYVYFHISSLYSHFITLSTGSARDNISQDTIKNILLPIPTRNILKLFDEKIGSIYQTIVNNYQQIDSLTKQRDELLPLLMNGQVSVNSDLSDD